MKATELMIGDWLFYKSQYNAFPLKVEQITKSKVGYHAAYNEGRLYYVRLDECKPILLTKEILEKNGLKVGSPDFFDEDGNYVLEISVNGSKIFWTINFHEYDILRLEYVHELQHALRLCKIEKEIVVF